MGDISYKFNPTHAAHYAAFAPIAWCMFFGWLILISQLGYHSKFNGFTNKYYSNFKKYFRQIYKSTRMERVLNFYKNIVCLLSRTISSVFL